MKDSRVYLVHVRDCINRIEAYTVAGKAAFFADLKTQDAVIRNLQTLCESTQRLPDDWKAIRPEIDWRTIGDFRNVLAHQYLDIDLDIVWNVVGNYLPDLKRAVDALYQQF